MEKIALSIVLFPGPALRCAVEQLSRTCRDLDASSSANASRPFTLRSCYESHPPHLSQQNMFLDVPLFLRVVLGESLGQEAADVCCERSVGISGGPRKGPRTEITRLAGVLWLIIDRAERGHVMVE